MEPMDIEPMDIDIDNIDKIKQRLSKELIGVSEVTNTPIRETITSQEFINRLNTGKDGKPGYDPNNKCVKENGKLYEYSELKSSLFINEVVNKNKQQLSEFINKISKNYCSTIGSDFNLEVSNYSKLLPTSIQINASKPSPYPVVDMSKFYNKPELIKSDFYASYNFMKYIWVSTFDKGLVTIKREVKSEKLENAITLENFIHLVQQPIKDFGETAKRNTRLNLPTPRLSNSLGISNITHPDLVQNHYWIHPGRTRCRVPYGTTYGNKLYDAYISEGVLNFHSSVQCGISGSVNFGIFMYMLSIANEGGPKGQELVDDILYLIFSVSAILVADGGHNIRETITGITLTSIALKSYKDKVKNEVARLPGEDLESKLTYIKNNFNNDSLPLYNSLKYENMYILAWFLERSYSYVNLQDTEPINIFINWLRAMDNWSSFIDELHKQLRQIDPMGIDLNTKMYTDLTLNDMLKEIGGGVRNAEREEEFYIYLQNIIFNDWYNSEGNVRETDGIDGKNENIYLERRKLAVNATALYTAFDKVIDSDGVLRRRFESKDRYTFWDGPTRIMNNFISLKTLEVNTKMQEVLDNCHGAKQLNATQIPYAGGKSTRTRRRKSTRSRGRKSTKPRGRKSTRSHGPKSTRSRGRKSTRSRGRKSTKPRGRKSHPLSK